MTVPSAPASALPEVRTEPFGGGALVQAALAAGVPRDWYAPVPPSPDEWHLHVDAVRRQFAAGAWLELLRPAFAPSGEAAARLERSAAGVGVVVTTGQQPGLFGGPLYTVAKALSARALADALEQTTGIATAPVFWAATDDADFAEASRTVVVNDGAAAELRAAPTAPDGTPMAAVPIGDDVPALLRRVAAGAGSAAYGPALDALAGAYRPGETVGSAYVALLRTLLEPLGITVLDASHPAVREAGHNLVRRALLGAPGIEQALLERRAAIEAAGFSAQVADVAGRSLVFRYDAAGRKARVPVPDARGLVASVARGALGPNVLLRPVIERSILPTVAYVAGPGEYAYFAQVSAVATALGVPQPIAVPRWSATIVEQPVRRALHRLGLDVDDLRDRHAAEGRLARAATPAGVRVALDALRRSLDDGFAALRAVDANDAAPLIPTAAVAGAQRNVEHRLARLERRYGAAVKRRDGVAQRDLAVARASLFPLGARQERALNPLPLLARYGPALLDAMLAAARPHAAALVGRGLAGVAATPDVARPRTARGPHERAARP